MDDSDLDQILTEIRRFVRTEVIPRETEIDEQDAIPASLKEQAKAMGLFGFALPERFGGLGLTMRQEVEFVLELSYAAPAFRSMFGTNNGLAGQILVQAGTEAQQQRWLPGIASGELVASFGLTEPEAGSDPASMTTSARREGEQWVLNGTKRWITNAPAADLIMVFARTDDGTISVFAVPTAEDGVTIGPKDVKMGQAGSLTAEVYLTDVRLEDDARVGGENGYRIAMASVARGRLSVAAICVGLMRRLLDESTAFALDRHQGGSRIADHQLIQALLADSASELYAAEAMIRRCADEMDAGTGRREDPSICKYFASEAVGRVADRAVQIHGGMGYMRGVAVERLYRDARLFRIYEGTSQIQQLIIGRAVTKAAERSRG